MLTRVWHGLYRWRFVVLFAFRISSFIVATNLVPFPWWLRLVAIVGLVMTWFDGQ